MESLSILAIVSFGLDQIFIYLLLRRHYEHEHDVQFRYSDPFNDLQQLYFNFTVKL